MKKYKAILIGALSLIIFGLLLPQPIQALLVLLDSPIKEFFTTHTLLLCVIDGVVQGLFEEGGYYLVLRCIHRKDKSEQIPVMFGLGRSSLHSIYDIGTILASGMGILTCFIALLSRVCGFGALMGLTMIDYKSIIKRRTGYLVLSILLHTIMNGVIYAGEEKILKVSIYFDSVFMICFSFIVIFITVLICNKTISNEV